MPSSARRSITPAGGEDQVMQTGLAERRDRLLTSSLISAARAAMELAMNSSESTAGSAAMTSRASGSRARASARNAVVGVRSSGLAADATETRSGRSRAAPAGLSAGVAR